MDIRLDKIKSTFFYTPEEKEQLEMETLQKDSNWGDPNYELKTMHNATKWGIYFFASITLLSTAAFIYRVGFPHLAELIGVSTAIAVMLVLAFGASLAIEVMLRGVGEPLTKKAFVKKQLDVWLLFLSVIFTGVIVTGALTGMEIITDTEKNAPKIESALAQSNSMTQSIEKNKAEIANLSSGKVKGVYSWKGKPTPQANARIKELEKQNNEMLVTIQSVNTSTTKLNETQISIYSDKTAKAVRYLSRLAIGSEILKWIIFLFWGYRSAKLLEWHGAARQFSPTPPAQDETSFIPQKKQLDMGGIEEAKQLLLSRLERALERNDSSEIDTCIRNLGKMGVNVRLEEEEEEEEEPVAGRKQGYSGDDSYQRIMGNPTATAREISLEIQKFRTRKSRENDQKICDIYSEKIANLQAKLDKVSVDI